MTGNWRDVDEPGASPPVVLPGRARARPGTAGFSIQEGEIPRDMDSPLEGDLAAASGWARLDRSARPNRFATQDGYE
jgi:hypothetical protein